MCILGMNGITIINVLAIFKQWMIPNRSHQCGAFQQLINVACFVYDKRNLSYWWYPNSNLRPQLLYFQFIEDIANI